MARKIVIPLEKKKLKSVPVKFPPKCVTCGQPMTDTLPEIIHRKYQIRSTTNTPVFEEHDLEPIEIPYCDQHYKAIRETDEQGKTLVGKFLYPILGIVGILSFILFYKPIFNWGINNSNTSFIAEAGPIARFLFAVFIILMITGLVSLGLIAIAGWVYLKIKNPPVGVKTYGAKNLYFTFKNEMIANEFLTLNQDLGARVYDFQKELKE